VSKFKVIFVFLSFSFSSSTLLGNNSRLSLYKGVFFFKYVIRVIHGLGVFFFFFFLIFDCFTLL
jgi:hypothetical protein